MTPDDADVICVILEELTSENWRQKKGMMLHRRSSVQIKQAITALAELAGVEPPFDIDE